VDFKYTNKEGKLKFKMSHNYARCRKEYYSHFMLDFCTWIGLSVISALIIFYVSLYAYGETVFKGGRTDSYWVMGHEIMWTMVVMHHGIVLVYYKNITWMNLAGVVGSFLVFFPGCIVLNDEIEAGAFAKSAHLDH
jgi:hypothetical protein